MAALESLRNEQDMVQAWPHWMRKLAKRVAQLERGRVHDIVLIMPDDDSEPQWVVQERGRVENGR